MESQKLEQSEANLRAIFENASEGFILVDRSGIVQTFNGNAKRYVLLNTGQELSAGQHLSCFIEGQITYVNDIIAKVLAGEIIEFDRFYNSAGNPPLWIHYCKTPVWENGVIVGVCIVTRNITKQKSLELEILDQKVQEQRKISRAIIKAEESERNYIAKELHDNVNQILAATKMYLTRAGKNNTELEGLITYPLQLLDSSMDEIRILAGKHVTPLKDLNLKPLVESLLTDLSKNKGIQTAFVYELPHSINDDLSLNIYRIIQEQVNNIGKHAQAKNVNISVQGEDAFIRIVIADDGRGFDVDQNRKGIGISNMINRVESFNGAVMIESCEGCGCKIQITIPN